MLLARTAAKRSSHFICIYYYLIDFRIFFSFAFILVSKQWHMQDKLEPQVIIL